MSKAKNRFRAKDDLVHFTRRPDRRNNYFVQACNGAIVYNATDEALALTCLVCMHKEGEHRAKVEADKCIDCTWCLRRIRFRDSYSPGDDAICADCNRTVPR